MKLVIAEKPAAAQSLARVIGATKRQDGYLEGPCRSNGPAFRADRSGAETGYLVSWCVGHLVELSSPERYDERFAKWRLEDLPILPEFQYTIQEYFRIGGVDYTGPRSAQAEKENDDITPFLGQYEHDGVTFQDGVRVTLRMIITENYIRLPNNGVNQMFYDSYEVDGNTLSLHLREVDWDYIITLRNRNGFGRRQAGATDACLAPPFCAFFHAAAEMPYGWAFPPYLFFSILFFPFGNNYLLCIEDIQDIKNER